MSLYAIKQDGFTKRQFSAFWRAFGSSCAAQGIKSTAEREAYRKQLMRDECHADHMSELNRTRDYDRLMVRLALDAEDYELAARYTSGDERRMAVLIESCAAQVMQLQGTDPAVAAAYVAGIVMQAGFSIRAEADTYWMDLLLVETTAVFQALDTHRRRLLAAAGWKAGLKFSHRNSYTRHADGSVSMSPGASHEPSFLRVRVRV